MVFPESERIVFKRNPLTQVICQLRFPPILIISTDDPAGFQERIRDVYPIYERRENPEVPQEIANLLSGVGLPSPAGDINHLFFTADRKQQIAISKNFVSVSTTNYERWEDFRAEIERAYEATVQEYQPSFYDRVGLRYLDSVDCAQLGVADADWPDLIKEEFVGPLALQPAGKSVKAFNAQVQFSLYEIPGSLVQVRYGLDENLKNFNVDADYYFTGQINEQQIFEALDVFNRAAGNLFRWVIKPKLRDALGRVEE